MMFKLNSSWFTKLSEVNCCIFIHINLLYVQFKHKEAKK